MLRNVVVFKPFSETVFVPLLTVIPPEVTGVVILYTVFPDSSASAFIPLNASDAVEIASSTFSSSVLLSSWGG